MYHVYVVNREGKPGRLLATTDDVCEAQELELDWMDVQVRIGHSIRVIYDPNGDGTEYRSDGTRHFIAKDAVDGVSSTSFTEAFDLRAGFVLEDC
tara:strand:+ start:2508 stop:2792 length:285 start_codon:yes stop_codon:yes gene_type:complete